APIARTHRHRRAHRAGADGTLTLPARRLLACRGGEQRRPWRHGGEGGRTRGDARGAGTQRWIPRELDSERLTMLTVIVAEDEKLARRRLVRLLADTGEAQVVAECAAGREAVDRTIALQPQLLFLDVRMPDLDGFNVLRELGSAASPEVVFVTAFDQYAVRAFDVHAVDYLLKPYDTERFRDAFERAKARIGRRADGDDEVSRMRALLRDYFGDHVGGPPERPGASIDRVAVRVGGVLRIIRTADIDWWETDGNYMRLHVGSTSHLIRATATSIEAQLDPRLFLRIHRRYIVNIDRVVEVQPWFGGDAVVVLRTGAKLRLSRTYRERLHARLLGVQPE